MMQNSLIAALFALTAAVSWGSGDFANGVASRKIGAFRSLLLSLSIGLLAMAVLVAASGEPLPQLTDIFWGVVGGLFGLTGFIFLMQGFVKGRMSIVAPVSAVLAPVVPVLISVLTLGLPGVFQLAGFALALVSIWMLSSGSADEGRPSGIGYALLAGLGFGIFFATLDQISEGVVFWPLLASRFVASSVLAVYLLVSRQPLIVAKTPWKVLITAGILDVGGNVFFLQAVQTGRLDIASVLVSLYPAVTVLLATLIVKERLNRLQMIGVVLAVTAIALITI
jgi:drug/metabolite transporter (DMT)-like permease